MLGKCEIWHVIAFSPLKVGGDIIFLVGEGEVRMLEVEEG